MIITSAVRHLLIVALITQIAGCTAAEPSNANAYIAYSGNKSIDGFIAAVQRRDESRVKALTYKFETISGLFPQYKTAREYLTRIGPCTISRVVQAGSDAAGEPVYIDWALKDGRRAAKAAYIYWIMWSCPEGNFRQALNADFHAPKLLVSELLPPTHELPTLRPPKGS